MKTAKLSDPKFIAYSVTAGTVLATAGSAQSQVVYSGPLSTTVSIGQIVNVDLAGPGSGFVFSQYSGIQRVAGAGAWQFAPKNLALSANIPAAVNVSNWVGAGAALLANSGHYGPFAGATGYLPIRLRLSPTSFEYGWIAYSATANASSATISGWAYQSTPDTSILAGVVPEPAQTGTALALLALGAAGAHRMRKQRVASSQRSEA